MNRSPKCKGPAACDREGACIKLRFLSTVIGGIGTAFDKGEMDDNDLWAISMLINGVAEQIYPEWKEAQS